MTFILSLNHCVDCSLSVLSVFIIPAKARDYVFTGVGLSVCLSVCLFVCLFVTTILNKTWTNLDKIFWEGS